jgi:hypothetical protein
VLYEGGLPARSSRSSVCLGMKGRLLSGGSNSGSYNAFRMFLYVVVGTSLRTQSVPPSICFVCRVIVEREVALFTQPPFLPCQLRCQEVTLMALFVSPFKLSSRRCASSPAVPMTFVDMSWLEVSLLVQCLPPRYASIGCTFE